MRNKADRFIGIIAMVLTAVMAMYSCSKSKDTPAAAVSFKTEILPILTSSCALSTVCHSGSVNSGNNVDFDSSVAYSSIMNKQLVIVSNPAASLLYVQVSTGVMPKAPYSTLPASQVASILDWIKQGAKNN